MPVEVGGQKAQDLGRSRGGFGTKIHAVVDALGLPVRFILGPGQQNDMAVLSCAEGAPACDLIDGFAADQVLAANFLGFVKLASIMMWLT